MLTKILYKLRINSTIRYNNKQNLNDKLKIMKNVIYIVKRLNESINYSETYHYDLYKSINLQLKNNKNSNLIGSCCVYVNLVDILNNLEINDVRMLYLCLENVDYVAKSEYNIIDIFSIVNKNDCELNFEELDSINMKEYKVKVNIIKFNSIYEKMNTNWWDSIMKNPLILFFVFTLFNTLFDKVLEVIITYKIGG